MIYAAITFPNLGISVDPSRIAFSVFGKPIYWYGILIAAGFLLAAIYACRRAKQFGLTDDLVIDMLIFAVPIAIICARVYFCVFNWSEFADDPISCVYIWNGGIAIYGAVIGGILTVLIFSKIRKVKMTPILDIGALGLLIGQCIGRWGNFINREAHGTVTNTFFKMGLTDAAGTVTYYHPTFLYESVWNLIGLILLHFYSKRRKYDGEVFTLYVMWYGFGRGFIEGLRTDSLYFFGTNLRVSQFLGFTSCIVAAGFFFYNRVLREREPSELYVNVKAAEAAAAEQAAAEANAQADEQENEKTLDQIDEQANAPKNEQEVHTDEGNPD